MTYWLVNSGTRERPWSGDLPSLYRQWNETHGFVQMFPWRPRDIEPGDVLIHRAVGSDGNRLVAVAEVLSEPEPSGHERWPWQVRRKLTAVCRSPQLAPDIGQIGLSASGLRVMKRVDDSVGARAVRLIEAAAQD